MIYESFYWKKDLLRLARKLNERKTKSIWDEADHGEFEKEIMIGFYIIRKLAEAQKLSNETISTKLKGEKIPNNGKSIDRLSIHEYPNYFDFTSAYASNFDVPFLWNQIIHSYVFSPYFSNNGESLLGIHFTSDANRNKFLFSLEIQILIDFFSSVGKDYPMHMTITYNEEKNDFKYDSRSSPDQNDTLGVGESI